jgi:hypothetical protein
VSILINLTIMKFQNRKLSKGIAMSIATLFTVSLITSCQKDNSVAPANSTTELGNSNATTTLASSGSSSTTYKSSGPVTAKSNTTYSGLVIDLGKAGTVGFTLNGVSNVHITNCKIINTTSYAINVYNSSNITIDNCFISNVAFGVNVANSKTVKVNTNQMLNINGNNAKGMYGHAVQFNQVTGGGNQINGNHIENIANVAQNPHDQLSLYKSSGLPGDSIQVNNNWIRGGEYNNNSMGHGCGIGLGDNGGSYQVARGNILVNPGFIGMEAAGGNHVKIDHNLIYSSQTPVSGGGLFFANYSGVSSTDVIYSYNQIKWINSQGKEFDYNNNGNRVNGVNVVLKNNTMPAKITASILPATIITMK